MCPLVLSALGPLLGQIMQATCVRPQSVSSWVLWPCCVVKALLPWSPGAPLALTFPILLCRVPRAQRDVKETSLLGPSISRSLTHFSSGILFLLRRAQAVHRIGTESNRAGAISYKCALLGQGSAFLGAHLHFIL